MWSIITKNSPGVALITGTGALYGGMMETHVAMVLLAGAGAFVGGLAAVGLFGHPGRWGWGLAALGAVIATALGAGLAGGFIHFPDGLWVAPIMVAAFPSDALAALPVWAAMMAITHLLMRQQRSTSEKTA